MFSRLFLIAFLCLAMFSFGQSESEIFLLDISNHAQEFSLSNGKNISRNAGYDNQPFFIDNNIIAYARTREDQTDIALYNIDKDTTVWFNNMTPGGEYSPQSIPGTSDLSAVRLDPDGKQELRRYSLKTGQSDVILNNPVVGYYIWADSNTLVSFALDDPPVLMVSDIRRKTNDTIQKMVGRSLHKIPNSNLVSFIDKQEKPWVIRSLNLETKTTQKITGTLSGVEDLCWTPTGDILMAKGSFLYRFQPKKSNGWERLAALRDFGITHASRLAISPDGSRLAVVGKPVQTDPEGVVQEQLDAYNARDVDWFMATYSEDVTLYNFPEDKFATGLAKMRDRYAGFFEATPDLHCDIKNRIVIGNKVIDEEYITANGRHFSAVAIYEVANGLITKVTFIRE